MVKPDTALFGYVVNIDEQILRRFDIDFRRIGMGFPLERRPDGMVIDSDTGVVEWQVVIPKGEVTYVFQVVAEDPEGGKSVQQITLKYGKGA